MSMREWARREVEIACKKERGDKPEGEWDYGCACYESALKAYESLLGDDHSGFSWARTAGILKRLMDNKPLTPIEDTEEVWGSDNSYDGRYKMYQCKRMGSLFKTVYKDGRVEYSDVDRVTCVDAESGSTYHNGFVRHIIDEMFPITMPYTGDDRYKVYCRDYLTDRKNGDLDTLSVLYAIDSKGTNINIYRHFKEAPTGHGWAAIGSDELAERIKMHEERIKEESAPKYTYYPEEKEE